MSKSKPVLGRGLASLIPKPVSTAQPPTTSTRQDDGVSDQSISLIDLDKVQANPVQPRADFDPVALDELKRSIIEKGIIQPITVRRAEGNYQLISGERRVRAAREAGLRQIPAYIIHVTTNEEMLELALIENLQREHLNPVEIAISYKRLIAEVNYTQDQLADKIGKDRSTIANFLRLLKLPDVIQTSLRRGQLSNGHARALINIEDPALQIEIFQEILERDLSVRDVERLVRQKGRKRTHRTSIASLPADTTLASIEDKLRQAVGTKVEIKALHDGKGQIVFEYYSADDLERLLDLFSNLGERGH
ncbi:MAG: ParB/RepB/Spo0J family partition protein [Bacteroidota bacterium]